MYGYMEGFSFIAAILMCGYFQVLLCMCGNHT